MSATLRGAARINGREGAPGTRGCRRLPRAADDQNVDKPAPRRGSVNVVVVPATIKSNVSPAPEGLSTFWLVADPARPDVRTPPRLERHRAAPAPAHPRGPRARAA
jgi:hypothetical protein